MAIIFPFDEVILDPFYDPMAEGGAQFADSIVSSPQSGVIQINATRPALHIYTVNYSLLTPEQKRALRDFFYLREGRRRGFRLLEPEDMSIFQDELIGVGDGAETEFFLKKIYQDTTRSYERRLTKIVAYTPEFSLDGNSAPYDKQTGAMSGAGAGKTVTINNNTGLVTITPAIANSVELRASGQFHLPVRFAANYFNARHEVTYGEWSGIQLIELLWSQIIPA